MTDGESFLLSRCWDGKFFAGFKVVDNLPEYPGVAFRASSYHYTVASGLFHKCLCLLGGCNISVTDNGDLNRFLYLPDDIPVCFSAVILGSGPAVNSHRIHACGFRGLSDLNGINMFGVKALSEFNGDRLGRVLYQLLHNAEGQVRVLHKRRAFTVINYLRHRTPHIEIKDIIVPSVDLLYNLPDELGFGAEKLE